MKGGLVKKEKIGEKEIKRNEINKEWDMRKRKD